MTRIGDDAPEAHIFSNASGEVVARILWASRTDVGKKREGNEDSLIAKQHIFAVADGMGGHSSGELASQSVVTALDNFCHHPHLDEGRLASAFDQAVSLLKKRTNGDERDAGTTVCGAALVISDGELPFWQVFNIGDSRLYFVNNGLVEQITKDHSVVQEMVDSGQLVKEEAENHPHANVITRALGVNESPHADYFQLPLVAGSRLLICSDGLTKELTSYGLRHFLVSHDDPVDAVNALVDAALANGGRDNVSVIVVDILGTV